MNHHSPLPDHAPNALGEVPNALGEVPNALGEVPNALGVSSSDGFVPLYNSGTTSNDAPAFGEDITSAGIYSFPNNNDDVVTSLGKMLKSAFKKAKSSETVKVSPNLRVERRGDRNPVGWALFERGKNKRYIGYVGSKSPDKEGLPSYQVIEREKNHANKNKNKGK